MFILFDAYLFELPMKFSQLWLVRDLNNRDGFYREGGAVFKLGVASLFASMSPFKCYFL